MTGITLDAGGLGALDKGVRRVMILLAVVKSEGDRVAVPAGALAQAWRGGGRHARLATLPNDRALADIVPLDGRTARVVGQLVAHTGVADVVDISVVVCARARGHRVVTSDPDDLSRVDPALESIVV